MLRGSAREIARHTEALIAQTFRSQESVAECISRERGRVVLVANGFRIEEESDVIVNSSDVSRVRGWCSRVVAGALFGLFVAIVGSRAGVAQGAVLYAAAGRVPGGASTNWPSVLEEIDPVTGAVSFIGPTGHGALDGMTYHPGLGRLLGITVYTNLLIEIDPVTGAANAGVPLTDGGVPISYAESLAYDPVSQEVFIGYRPATPPSVCGNSCTLGVVNPANGAITPLALVLQSPSAPFIEDDMDGMEVVGSDIYFIDSRPRGNFASLVYRFPVPSTTPPVVLPTIIASYVGVASGDTSNTLALEPSTSTLLSVVPSAPAGVPIIVGQAVFSVAQAPASSVGSGFTQLSCGQRVRAMAFGPAVGHPTASCTLGVPGINDLSVNGGLGSGQASGFTVAMAPGQLTMTVSASPPPRPSTRALVFGAFSDQVSCRSIGIDRLYSLDLSLGSFALFWDGMQFPFAAGIGNSGTFQLSYPVAPPPGTSFAIQFGIVHALINGAGSTVLACPPIMTQALVLQY